MLWQSGKCIRGANCAVIHASAFPISDGTVCMSKSHNSMNHVNTSYLPVGTNSSDASHSLTPSASKVQSSSPFGCLQPWVQPLLCMHRNGLLKPMRMGSFLLRHILLFRLSLISLVRSWTWHQISHQPFRLHQLLISLHQHAFSLLSNMRLLQMREGQPPALCLSKALLYKEAPPPQFHRCFRIVLLTGSVRSWSLRGTLQTLQ